MISESAMLGELAAEFPGYEFSTQRTWEGVSLIAVRQDGSDRPGLCVDITPTSTRCAAPCSRAWDSNAGSAQPELIMNLYGVNAAFMSLYLHECGIHTKDPGTDGARVAEVRAERDDGPTGYRITRSRSARAVASEGPYQVSSRPETRATRWAGNSSGPSPAVNG